MEITRAFLALCNMNLIAYAPQADQDVIHRQLNHLTRRQIQNLAGHITSGVRQCQAVGGSLPRSTAPSRSASGREPDRRYQSTMRSTVAAEMARARDNARCVLTLKFRPEVAHIITHSLGRTPGTLVDDKPDIFQLLKFLAGPSVIQNLTEYLLTPQGIGGRTRINRLENLLCLSETEHVWFGHGWFVLEPVGDPLATLLGGEGTLRSYDVRFSWVPQYRARGR
ncbi:hypothetical protein BGX38DRAFT_263305 [Terfezia claveryi]|nr:hypothetical protein BGX38DRAFT_263305 [Terfezia claveryi]